MDQWLFESNKIILSILNIFSLFLTLLTFIRDECINKNSQESRTIETDRQRRRAIFVNRILKIFLILGVITSAYISVQSEMYVEVPNLVNIEYKEACAILAEKGITFVDNEEYSAGNYFVTKQSVDMGTLFHKKESLPIEMECEKRYDTEKEIYNNEEETYAVTILGGKSYFADIGNIISLEAHIETPDEYKFETTPFILYVGYYDRTEQDWIQISGKYIDAGEVIYTLKIDTLCLGIPAGDYLFEIALFSAADYAKGNALSSSAFQVQLNGMNKKFDDDVYDRMPIEYEKKQDVFVINEVAYKFDVEELVLSDVGDEDVEKLKHCSSLKKLQISGENITNLEPLEELKTLEELYVQSKNLINLEPIANLSQLKVLSVGGGEYNGLGFSGKLSDISPIADLTNLESLTISDCQVEDIKCIENLFNLRYLGIYKTQVYDISVLNNFLLLEDVRLHNNEIVDVTALYDLKRLRYLTLSNNPLEENEVEDIKKVLPQCEIVF